MPRVCLETGDFKDGALPRCGREYGGGYEHVDNAEACRVLGPSGMPSGHGGGGHSRHF